MTYMGITILGVVILGGAPLLIYQLRNPDWIQHAREATADEVSRGSGSEMITT